MAQAGRLTLSKETNSDTIRKKEENGLAVFEYENSSFGVRRDVVVSGHCVFWRAS
jgi:hypothetical protein